MPDVQENLRRSEVSSLEKIGNATRKVNTSLENLNSRLESLESEFANSAKSSGRLALSLNILTAVLVVVGVAQVLASIYAK
jgi:hypothetical protein